MDKQEFMNDVYDVLAQNNISTLAHNGITEKVDHVDTDRNAIVFKLENGKEFELQLVDTFAPASSE